MFDSLVQLIAPHRCIGCGIEGKLWCNLCRSKAPITAERCYRCHRLSPAGRTCKACRRTSPLYAVRAATRYDGQAKRLVWHLKFGRARAGGAVAGALIAERIPFSHEILLTHVPAVTSHIRRRGYDQAALIAHAYAKQRGVRHQPTLLRVGQQQQRGQARAQRLTQLDGAFRVLRPEHISGRHIVLTDDVVTTGATLEAAARALKAAGASRVSAIVFAQA